MSTQLVGDTTRVVPRARSRARTGQSTASTSIRVSVAARDALAAQAAAAEMSLSQYLERMARREEREAIFAEFRAAQLEAYQDPAFVAELLEWEEADDGIDFDDDGWPEYNQ